MTPLDPNRYGDIHGPDCLCLSCSYEAHLIAKQIYDRHAGRAAYQQPDQKETEMSRTQKREVEIKKVIGRGEMPPFLGLIQRHFEKSKPTVSGDGATLIAPVDMLGMIVPDDLLSNIESLEIIYKKQVE